MSYQHNRKKVIIAGAGPGDPELITIKALRYLQKADIVLCDRLVNIEILDSYVNNTAEIIYVGKEGYNSSSTSQTLINQLLVKYASQNKLVVRLKGGDVSVFSNILDELTILTENKIPFEIIPGITAASGAAAYAGIPLTARGYSSGVRFLTYHDTSLAVGFNWIELAETDDTLVFYMSAQNLDVLIETLIFHSISPNKLFAVIEHATLSKQQVMTGIIADYASKYRNQKFSSPSLVIIGKVVELHDSFSWFSIDRNEEDFNHNKKQKISDSKILSEIME